MLDLHSSNNGDTIEVKSKEIQIVLEEEFDFSLSIEVPSAENLIKSHCTPNPTVALKEVCALDPFNFDELINEELFKLNSKYERYKDSPTFITKTAGLSSLSGDFELAEKLLEEGLSQSSEPFLIHELGNALVQKGDLDKAFKVFQESDLSKDVFSNLRLAFIKTKQNDSEKACEFLEKAIEIDPSDFRSRMFRGAINLNNGQCEKAIRDFRVANAQKDDSSALHVNLAASYWSLGQTKKAVRELQKAIKINPLNENAIIFYCDALFSLGEYIKPIESLEFFTDYDEKSDFIWDRLARSYYCSKDYFKARVALEKQSALSDDPSILNNLGLVHWKLKDPKKALSYLEHSLKKAGTNIQKASYPVLNLAGILTQAKQSEESLRLISEFLKVKNATVEETIISKIYIQELIALESTTQYERLAYRIEEISNETRHFKYENNILLMVYKIYAATVISNDYDLAGKAIMQALANYKEHNNRINNENKKLIFNNICFSFLYFGDIAKAEKFISFIAPYIHKDSFCTATLGLFRIKKGNFEQGKQLYEQAIKLTNKQNLKAQIKQRFFIEAGKYFVSINDARSAKKYFQRAAKEKQGHFYAIEEASKCLRLLT